jgi:hypothetical protein
MELAYIKFDSSCARKYRKTSRVLAFQSEDPFDFHKSWGLQHLPEGSWIIIPLMEGRPTGDVYGCNREAFATTYRPTAGDQSHTYEKHAVVLAYQPCKPFVVRTIVAGYSETDPAMGGATDWLVQNPLGEIYAVRDVVFRATYQSAE